MEPTAALFPTRHAYYGFILRPSGVGWNGVNESDFFCCPRDKLTQKNVIKSRWHLAYILGQKKWGWCSLDRMLVGDAGRTTACLCFFASIFGARTISRRRAGGEATHLYASYSCQDGSEAS